MTEMVAVIRLVSRDIRGLYTLRIPCTGPRGTQIAIVYCANGSHSITMDMNGVESNAACRGYAKRWPIRLGASCLEAG